MFVERYADVFRYIIKGHPCWYLPVYLHTHAYSLSIRIYIHHHLKSIYVPTTEDDDVVEEAAASPPTLLRLVVVLAIATRSMYVCINS